MKKGIVFKLSLTLVVLFTIIFLFMEVSQKYFFEKYYIEKKSEDLKLYMNDYKSLASKVGVNEASKEFYQNENIWITRLDKNGFIDDLEDNSIEVELYRYENRSLKISMDYFQSEYSSDISDKFNIGEEVSVDAVIMGEELIPYIIQSKSDGIMNLNIANKLHGPDSDKNYAHLKIGAYRAGVKNIIYPREDYIFLQANNRYFLEKMKEFQAELLLNNMVAPKYMEDIDEVENLVKYRIIVEEVEENGEVKYIFAMTSLQPVNEAMGVIKQFYPYYLVFAFICIIILSIILSKGVTKPLLAINDITGKISRLDFTERLEVKTKDEVGQLSKNINYMADQMETYIMELEDDLEKEKKLKVIRKEFIANVSHELKTPLAVMKSCISILRDNILPNKREYYFDALESEIEEMNSLVYNMLELAKFESGTYKPEMESFKLDDLVLGLCKSFKIVINQKKLDLEVNVKPIYVIGNKSLVARVITNFMANAINHTSEGNRIKLYTSIKDGIVEISLENDGEHIESEKLSKIWDEFYQLEGKTNMGTGLGLSISKEILKLHKSDFGVENIEGGVRFFFTLSVEA